MTARRAPGMASARRCEARWTSGWSSAPETTSVGCCTWASRAMAGGARGSLGAASARAKVPRSTTMRFMRAASARATCLLDARPAAHPRGETRKAWHCQGSGTVGLNGCGPGWAVLRRGRDTDISVFAGLSHLRSLVLAIPSHPTAIVGNVQANHCRLPAGSIQTSGGHPFGGWADDDRRLPGSRDGKPRQSERASLSARATEPLQENAKSAEETDTRIFAPRDARQVGGRDSGRALCSHIGQCRFEGRCSTMRARAALASDLRSKRKGRSCSSFGT